MEKRNRIAKYSRQQEAEDEADKTISPFRRRRCPVRYWVAVAGTLEDPLPDEWQIRAADWLQAHGSVHMFSVKPTIRTGDRLVMYASGTPARLGAGRFFAVREVVRDPEPSTHERWPCKAEVRDLVTGPDLPHCPKIDEIGVAPKSLRRHTHIKLDADAGALAESLLEQARRRWLGE